MGIAGAINSQLLKYLFGVYFTHPGFFVGTIVAAVVLQFGSEKLEESTLLGEIDNICLNLQVVTSNLFAHYTHCSQTLSESFIHHDSKRVVQAVNLLLDGQGKDNKAAQQRHFDERDHKFDHLTTVDLMNTSEFNDKNNHDGILEDWVAVVEKKEGPKSK